MNNEQLERFFADTTKIEHTFYGNGFHFTVSVIGTVHWGYEAKSELDKEIEKISECLHNEISKRHHSNKLTSHNTERSTFEMEAAYIDQRLNKLIHETISCVLPELDTCIVKWKLEGGNKPGLVIEYSATTKRFECTGLGANGNRKIRYMQDGYSAIHFTTDPNRDTFIFS